MPKVDIDLDSLTAHVGLSWTKGDTPVIRSVQLATPGTDVVPPEWVGTHAGTIKNPVTGATVASVAVVVTSPGPPDDDLLAVFTVSSPAGVPAGRYEWSARQTSGTDAGIVHFANSLVIVERTHAS